MKLHEHPRVRPVLQKLYQNAAILAAVALFLWFLEVLDRLLIQGGLDQFGIHPRTLVGLRNIFLAPFLHADFGHLFANTIPFIVLGWFVMLRGRRTFAVVSVVTALVSGLGIWLLGAGQSVHIGISGVIFGYLGYLLAMAYLERSLPALGLGLLAFLMYGGMLFGVLPGRPGVSWLGHLFGLLGGAMAAYLLIDTAYLAQRGLPGAGRTSLNRPTPPQ